MSSELKIVHKSAINADISHLDKINSLKEFIGFIRPKICLFVTGIGIAGYLMFNSFDLKLLFVALASFFATAFAYTYNMITDKEEDLLNHKKLNRFVQGNSGIIFVGAFVVLGAIFSLYLSKLSVAVYFLLSITGAVYSYFRIKSIFPFKNLYTGFILSLVFLLGSAANSSITMQMIIYYLAISLHIVVISLISDLRDYEGDKSAGIKTVPVAFGYYACKKIIYGLLILFTLSVIALNLEGLFSLLPFIIPMVIYLKMNKPYHSHVAQMFSFMFLPFGIIFIV